VILLPFEPGATYREGDYVVDPDTNVIFQVAGEGTSEVYVGLAPPAQNDAFVVARNLPEK
jgi:hypothetical protein